METKKTKGSKKKGDNSPAPDPGSAAQLVNEAIRLAEVEIAKGKRTGQGIGGIRMPRGAGKKK
jgi:hypothetical protein